MVVRTFSSPEPTILLVCAKDRDLWQGPQHSRPQSPRSFWSAPRIETSGRDRSRKSANHGLPAFVRSLRNLNNNGYYRLQKWAAIALARYLAPARGLDPWRRPKGSWALGTRMGPQQEVRESRTSGFCAQPQKFETITVTIGYKNGHLLRLRVTWTLPEVSILGADQKDRGLWGRECG